MLHGMRDLPRPGVEPVSLHWQVGSFQMSHQRSPRCKLLYKKWINKVLLEASLVAQRLKCLPAMRETRVRSLGREDPPGKEMATHSRILAWRIPWVAESGGLQSPGSQRVGHD